MSSSSTIDKQLANRIPATTDTQLLYTVPSLQCRTYIRTIIVCNVTAASKTYSLWINQNGQNVADQYAMRKNITIAANASDQIIYPQGGSLILNGDNNHSGASILCQASAANALTFHLFGTEVVET